MGPVEVLRDGDNVPPPQVVNRQKTLPPVVQCMQAVKICLKNRQKIDMPVSW